MSERAFQDFYPSDYAICYGCGRLNPAGLHIRSVWDGDESVCHFTPRPEHTAVAGFVYGGLLASLIDCHGTGTAAAAAYRAAGRPMDSLPPLRFVTASLRVDYRKPTPLGVPLVLRGRIVEQKERKAVVAIRLIAEGQVCVEGHVVAVQIPESMRKAPEAP
jgi:acyl-coenzyme A thioesterase PaaI-like protein